MAKKVNWTFRAQQDRLEILEYWANRNKSKVYSAKLYKSISNHIKLIAQAPEIGKPTEFPEVRFIIVIDYLIYYSNHADNITILTIWDSRRNPAKLKL
jgi:plasmid stabilization system protein ParE